MAINLGGSEKPIKYFYGEIKKGFFGPKENISLLVFPSSIEGRGFKYSSLGEVINNKSDYYQIPMEKVTKTFKKSVDDFDGLVVEYSDPVIMNRNNKSWLFVPNVPDVDLMVTACLNAKSNFMEIREAENKQKLAKEKEIIKDKERNQAEAKNFYLSRLNFNIKSETPHYFFHQTDSSCICAFVGEKRSFNFLKIDGASREENLAVIDFKDFHYFDKAGSIQYVNDLNATYSSYGGSFTGASISKLATVGGGLLFGAMGMAVGAALTLKPSQYESPNVDFKIDSDIKKIDSRNILLNFYSQDKKQYVDIELPLEMFNFLQTYYPEKRYEIVLEVERKTAAAASQDQIQSGVLLPNSTPAIEAKPTESNSSDDLTEFKNKVNKLKIMKEAGLLSDDEFQAEKIKLLSSI